MSKTTVKGSTLLAPLPAVLVSCGAEKHNLITIAWTGVVSSDPPRVYISVRKERYSYDIIDKGGDFVINLVSENLLPATDWCGIRSGRDVDKFAEMGLTAENAEFVTSPMVKESPINLECKVLQKIAHGSHDMFIADVLAVHADDSVMQDGRIAFEKAHLVNYQHGEYYATGKHLGRFGFAVQKEFIKRYGKGVNVNLASAKLTKRKKTTKKGK